jgi:SPP1 family predicted phage head-tail adaptor
MSLLDEYSAECTLLVKTRTDDPVGGYKTDWVNGAKFTAAWEYESAPEVTVAEQQGVERTYRIYVDKTLDLDYHEAFRRNDNSQVYRVTNPGTDRKTPSFSRLNRRVIEVEKWELPHNEEE